ncbi:MAG: putative toxin-antitoxin system toxin component, PIN family [Prevotella sp.]|nr:putative toxin-antitoxin system toxin component, PIN family [Prevotella sp.]MBP3212122.1 putative toxin-antitoxin system toxin component, PIN family [Prevotella sp.]
MNIVLDTNCLLMSLSRRSPYYPVWRDFVDGKYTFCITNEILAEYEEILTNKVGAEIASHVITAILDLPNTKMVQIYYHLRLVTADPDDDKFVDCAFKSNARYIVTQDHHYDVLKQTPFPFIDVVDIDEFIKVLRG